MTNTKRLALLWVAVAAMVCIALMAVAFLPARAAFAEETAVAADDTNAASHTDHDGWTELTADGGTLESGNYYLAGDVTLTTDITIAESATVTLCLNGYKLTGTGEGIVITVSAGANFTLEDCRSASESAECQHAYYVADSGLWVFYDGELPEDAPAGAETGVVTGGVITGGSSSAYAAAFYLNSATMTMKGGTIAGNTAPSGGAAVYVFATSGYPSSTFTMEDGVISGNILSGTSGSGAAVYVYSGVFTMKGGKIVDNAAARGGGVYMYGGTFTMEGGTISGNTASTYGGGGVYVGSDVTFTMKNGTISGNTASTYGGGGVYMYGGTFTMEGGTISGNTASNYGGGVYVSTSGTFTMTGGYFGDTISSGGTISVSGGYFAESPDAAFIAENCVAQDISVLGGAEFDGDYIAGFPFAVYQTAEGLTANAIENIVYDGSPVAADVDFTVTGAEGATLAYAYAADGGSDLVAGLPTNAGAYTVYVYALNGEKQFSSAQFDITIAKANYDMSGITFEDGSFTYDGTEHSLAISATLPEGVTVNYENNGKVNAGEYTVTATFTGDADNYEPIDDMTATLTINKATYDMSGITFEDGSFTYDGDSHSLAISGTLPDGVSVNYTGNGKVNAGEYTVTATFTGDADNYEPIDDMIATLTIVKAVPAYTAPTELTVRVDGTLADITLPEGWAWKDSSVQLTETGEYKAVAVYTPADTANFVPVEVELMITVLKPEGLSGGAIAGIVIGSTVGAALIAYGVCALLFKKKIVSGAFFAKIYPFIK